ncbi:TPA: single-stranded DNA-binding protein [Candidatus Gracilibacteria bacterium]|nr:single-stranded DNA-binding protein [Candidatus Gracilibacteria bacterium]
MYALNRSKFIGYVIEKPELRTIPSGMEVCDVNIRVISKVVKEDGSVFNSTSFHTATFWGGIAKTVGSYTNAGSQIYIEGRLKTDSWQGEDGKARYKTKIIAEDLILLSRRDGDYPALQSDVVGTGLNEVELIGNITKDVELRATASGQSVASTSIATNRKWKNRQTNEFQEETEFHNIVLWGDLAKEADKNVSKGSKVYIKGRLQNRSWETPEGEKRYTTEVIVESISALGHEAPVAMNSENYSAPAKVVVATSAPVTQKEEVAASTPDLPTISYESDIKPEDLPF